jgi:DoxX-like family
MSFYCSGILKISLVMTLLNILIVFSSLSFMGYGIAYFKSPHMKGEFKRFGLEKAGALTAVLELLGAVGLLVGLKFDFILLIASAGLALLMLLGVAIRIKVKDSLWISFPAIFFMILNSYIFYAAFIY